VCVCVCVDMTSDDCSARKIRHVGDLYPLASRIFW
jgi:hypothetical protein